MFNIHRLGSRKGFTLIEMLIVIAIIGILSSVVLVGLGPVQRRGRDARRQADLREVQNALELYFSKCGHYPGGADCDDSIGSPDWAEMAEALKGAGIGINQIPNDPSAGGNEESSRNYDYATDGSGTTYVLGATLEDAGNPALNDSLKVPPGSINIDCDGDGRYCISL